MSEDEAFSGAVLEGEQGELYLIPDSALAKFRVSASKADQLQAELVGGADADGNETGSDTAGFAFSPDHVGGALLPNIRPLKPVVPSAPGPLTAIQGYYQQQGLG